MENKKDLTKELLADCFKELIMTVPFDKITIKMITDDAGLIRPTFYNYFQDKYEVLEWIFKTEVTDSVDLMINNHMEGDALLMLCRCLERDRKFYRKCYAMDGPNSFDNLLTRYVYSTLLGLAKKYSLNIKKKVPLLTHEMLATYYTYGLVNVIHDWLNKDMECTAEELSTAYKYLLSHSVVDLLKQE